MTFDRGPATLRQLHATTATGDIHIMVHGDTNSASSRNLKTVKRRNQRRFLAAMVDGQTPNRLTVVRHFNQLNRRGALDIIPDDDDDDVELTT